MWRVKVKTLAKLKRLADRHKAVICPDSMCWNRPRPASFMLHLQGAGLLNLFRLGMYVYEKGSK